MANLWRSDRLVYRGIDPEDDDFLSELNADSEAFANMSPIIPVPRNKQTATRFREWLTSDQQIMAAIICLPAPAPETKTQETGKDKEQEQKPKPIPIGILHLTGDAPSLSHHRKCEIGLSIHASRRNQGYGSEAILYALSWGFRRANLHRMGIGAFGWNQGAIRLYKKLGFVEEARRREFFWYDGEYWDCVELAMLEGEWRGRYGGKKK